MKPRQIKIIQIQKNAPLLNFINIVDCSLNRFFEGEGVMMNIYDVIGHVTNFITNTPCLVHTCSSLSIYQGFLSINSERATRQMNKQTSKKRLTNTTKQKKNNKTRKIFT